MDWIGLVGLNRIGTDVLYKDKDVNILTIQKDET